ERVDAGGEVPGRPTWARARGGSCHGYAPEKGPAMLRGVSPHDHPHHAHDHPHRHLRARPRDPAELSRLRIVLALTAGFLVVEVVGGLYSHSLALLADAGHMLADVGGLSLSLFAFRLARRPASWEKTYGYVCL